MFWYPRAIQITERSSWHFKTDLQTKFRACLWMSASTVWGCKGLLGEIFACCKNLCKSLASDYRILKYLLLIEENNFFL